MYNIIMCVFSDLVHCNYSCMASLLHLNHLQSHSSQCLKHVLAMYEALCVSKHLWRNRLARSAVNRKVAGSSPARCEHSFFFRSPLSHDINYLLYYLHNYFLLYLQQVVDGV